MISNWENYQRNDVIKKCDEETDNNKIVLEDEVWLRARIMYTWNKKSRCERSCKSAMQSACSKYLTQRILSSGGLFSVESIPGRAAATLLNS